MPVSTFWTPDRTKILRELHAQGKSAAEIASVLDVSYSAVFSKLEMLGLRPNRSAKFRPISDIAPDLRDRAVALARMGHAQKVVSEQTGLTKYDVQRIVAQAGVVWAIGCPRKAGRP